MTRVIVNGVELLHVLGVTISPNNTKIAQLCIEDNKLVVEDNKPVINLITLDCLKDNIEINVMTVDEKLNIQRVCDESTLSG